MARPRDPQIDRLVVQACVELLDERGRAGLSRAQIAERAGVSLPAVNRRFADVDAILVQVARTPGRELDRATLSPEERWPPETSPHQSLRDFLTAELVSLARAFDAGGVRRAASEILAAAAGNEDIDHAFQTSLAGLRTEGLEHIERAKASGEVARDTDGDLLLDLVTGSAYYRLLWRGEAIDEGQVQQVVDLVLRGAGRP